jgi:hypothetical protein
MRAFLIVNAIAVIAGVPSPFLRAALKLIPKDRIVAAEQVGAVAGLSTCSVAVGAVAFTYGLCASGCSCASGESGAATASAPVHRAVRTSLPPHGSVLQRDVNAVRVCAAGCTVHARTRRRCALWRRLSGAVNSQSTFGEMQAMQAMQLAVHADSRAALAGAGEVPVVVCPKLLLKYMLLKWRRRCTTCTASECCIVM